MMLLLIERDCMLPGRVAIKSAVGDGVERGPGVTKHISPINRDTVSLVGRPDIDRR